MPARPARPGALRLLARIAAAACVLVCGAWCVLALWFQLPPAFALLLGASIAVATLATIALVLALPRAHITRILGLAVGVTYLLVLSWWLGLSPSHERDWQPDVARLLAPEVKGNIVTLDNVRAFDWETEQRFTERWERRQYDLDHLVSADLVLSYWMGPHIAHSLVSFGFDDGRQLVFSLEIRKEQGEAFSAIAGFFRRYEQVIIAADEHDIVRTRSNARGEDVVLYRLRASPEQLRAVLLAYLERAGSLRREPQFYNTLTSNCTTILFELAREIDPDLPLDWRLLASGHFAEYAYDHEGLVPGYTYEELARRGHINARALQTDAPSMRHDSAAFSRAIRVGIPGMREALRTGTTP